MKRQFLKILLSLSIALLFYAGCSGLNIFSNKKSSALYSLIPTSGLYTYHIPNEEFFYVNFKPGNYEGEGYDSLDALMYAMDDGPGTDCKIPVDQESTEDLYCLMDIMEGDIWYHSFILDYNVPEGMCDFLSFEVPWHFNQIVANGPSRIYQKECEGVVSASGTEREIKQYYFLKLNGDCEDDPKFEDIERMCDTLNKTEVGLGNCCFGQYELTVEKDQSTTVANWGGQLRNCIGGLGRWNWTAHNEDGRPLRIVTPTAEDGLIESYEIPAAIDAYEGVITAYEEDEKPPQRKEPSFITANYWIDAENKDFLNNMPSVYKAPTRNLPGQRTTPYTRPSTGYPYLTWSCLNAAREVKHRIHLLIREWNTQAEFHSFVESQGSRGNPDEEGAEGSICEYYEAEEGSILRDSECNDFWDLDNYEALGNPNNNNPYPKVKYQ